MQRPGTGSTIRRAGPSRSKPGYSSSKVVRSLLMSPRRAVNE